MIWRWLLLALVATAIAACTRSVLLTLPPDAGGDAGVDHLDGSEDGDAGIHLNDAGPPDVNVLDGA